MSVKHTLAGESAGESAGEPGEVPPSTTRWYLVQSEARREIMADNHLTQNGYRTYLPSTLRTLRHARQLRTIETPFFAGHLFVALDLETQDWRVVASTPGVVRLFVIDDHPAPAPAGLVEALMEAVGLDDPQEPAKPLAIDGAPGVAASHFGQRLGQMSDLSNAERVCVLVAIMTGEAVADGRREAGDASGG